MGGVQGLGGRQEGNEMGRTVIIRSRIMSIERRLGRAKQIPSLMRWGPWEDYKPEVYFSELDTKVKPLWQ